MNFSYSPEGEGRVAMPADHSLQDTESENSVAELNLNNSHESRAKQWGKS